MTAETGGALGLQRGFRWLWRAGLAVPLMLGVALVAIVGILLISPRYHTPSVANAGSPDDYPVGEPRYFEEQRFWLVNLGDGEFVALYDRDPVSGCTLPWHKDYEHLGRTGWFRDACSDSLYDLRGNCFGGSCEIGLNRLNVRLEGGELIVDPRDGPGGELRDDTLEPVNPPQ